MVFVNSDSGNASTMMIPTRRMPASCLLTSVTSSDASHLRVPERMDSMGSEFRSTVPPKDSGSCLFWLGEFHVCVISLGLILSPN